MGEYISPTIGYPPRKTGCGAQAHWRTYKTVFDDIITAILIAGSGVRTADIPCSGQDNENAKDTWDRYRLDCAAEFTQTIRKCIQDSPDKPTIVSIGIDGWGCDTDRIRDFINTERSSQYVFRTTFIDDKVSGITFKSDTLHRSPNAWWGNCSSDDISKRIRRDSKVGSVADELVSFWNMIQGRKGTKSYLSLQVGRNKK